MFASNKVYCLLISTQRFLLQLCTDTHIHVHPALQPQIPEQPQCIQSGQWWSSCSTCVARVLWLLGAQPQGTRAGTHSVREARGCGRDVTTSRGRSEALPTKYWRHMAKKSYVNIWCKVQFYCVMTFLYFELLCFKAVIKKKGWRVPKG